MTLEELIEDLRNCAELARENVDFYKANLAEAERRLQNAEDGLRLVQALKEKETK